MRHWLSKTLLRLSIILFMSAFFQNSAEAQYVFSNDSLFKAGQENTGRLWGYAFGDFAYKGHADSLTRGGSNQYTGIRRNRYDVRSSVVFIWDMIIISLKNSQPNCYSLQKTIFLREPLL